MILNACVKRDAMVDEHECKDCALTTDCCHKGEPTTKERLDVYTYGATDDTPYEGNNKMTKQDWIKVLSAYVDGRPVMNRKEFARAMRIGTDKATEMLNNVDIYPLSGRAKHHAIPDIAEMLVSIKTL